MKNPIVEALHDKKIMLQDAGHCESMAALLSKIEKYQNGRLIIVLRGYQNAFHSLTYGYQVFKKIKY